MKKIQVHVLDIAIFSFGYLISALTAIWHYYDKGFDSYLQAVSDILIGKITPLDLFFIVLIYLVGVGIVLKMR